MLSRKNDNNNFKLGHSANTRSGIGWLLTRAESDEITLLRERVMFKCSNSDSDSDGDITKKNSGQRIVLVLKLLKTN